MRSATLFGLVLTVACYGCGGRNVPSESGSQAGQGDADPSSHVGGSSQPAGTGQASTGGRGGVPDSAAGANAGSGVPSGVAGGGTLGGAAGDSIAGKGGSLQATGGGRAEAGGSAGGSANSASGGAKETDPILPYPQGDPTPQPLPARPSGTPLLTDTLIQGEKDRTTAGEIGCQCMVGNGLSPSDVESCSRGLYGVSACGSLAYYGAPPVFQCCLDVLNSTSLGDATTQCLAQASAALAACVTAAQCNDPNSVCRMHFGDATGKCPPLPYDLDATIQKLCNGRTLPPPMICDDGTRIDPSLMCNRTADCSHGEDERSEYCKGW